VDTGDAVLKIAPPGKQSARLSRQSRFLVSREDAPVLPRVYSFGDGWALMEKLSPTVPPFYETFTRLQELWMHTLRFPLDPDPDWPEHVLDYGYRIAPDLAAPLAAWLTPGCSVPVVTHGDPTLDNMMSRGEHGEPVLVDPLPPERHTPPLRALDVGKILQSLWGWHEAEYSPAHPHLAQKEAITGFLLSQLPPSEARAAWAFAVYNLIRALPYARHRQPVYAAARRIVQERLTR